MPESENRGITVMRGVAANDNGGATLAAGEISELHVAG